MLYTDLKIGNKDTDICIIERKLVFLQRRKTTKMQKGYTILSGKNTMSESGILKVYFDTFSSKNVYGVTFINSYNQSCSVDFLGCSFNGKEKDYESGFHYYGARYYWSEVLTGWLSVDPMADKYPSISPYAYCAWNPVKLVDPDGNEAVDDGWKVDNQNKTITRVNLCGGDYTQYVEGDSAPVRYNTSRDDLLNEYKDYTVIDNNTQVEAQLNPIVEREKADAISAGTVAGVIAGGISKGASSMSKAFFDKDNGTYMGKDGSIKQIKIGKNGGLNGRYKSQIKASAKYAKLGRVFTALGVASALVSAKNTESQYQHGQISNMQRLTNHAVDILGCTPVGWMAPFAYELGANYGPSTWLKK